MIGHSTAPSSQKPPQHPAYASHTLNLLIILLVCKAIIFTTGTGKLRSVAHKQLQPYFVVTRRYNHIMTPLNRNAWLPGWTTHADSRVAAVPNRRLWFRSQLSTNKRAPSVPLAALRVVVNLVVLLGLMVLLHHRAQQYVKKQHRSSSSSSSSPDSQAARKTFIEGPTPAASVAGGTVADASSTPWLPPPWVGTPPPVDPLACTPQLLVIGGMKCGTSALFHYLNGTVPRSPKAAKQPGASWKPPQFNNDQQFLNGTTASIEYCNRFFNLPDEQRRFHPGVIGSIVTKEVHFFDQDPLHVKTHLPQYWAKFAGVDMTVDDPSHGKCSYPAQLGLTSSSAPALVRLEATVMYMPSRTAAGLVKDVLPNTRLVALLREPVSRALSSINMVIQRGDFPELKHLARNTSEYGKVWQAVVVRELRKEMTLVDACFDRVDKAAPVRAQVDQMDVCMLAGQQKLSERVLDIHLGLYALHLERWFSYFDPQQLLIWSTKAFKEAPWHHMEQLVRWLGMDVSKCRKQGDFLKMHKRSYPDGSLPQGFIQEVAEFYEPHNQRLFALLESKGYHAVVEQLRRAWPAELASTIEKLEQQ